MVTFHEVVSVSMKPRQIGFATCEKYRELAPSDRLTADLLREFGCEVRPMVWTETAAAEITCDLVVIRSVWDYHLQISRFLEWVDAMAQRAVVLNAPAIIRWNCDKRYLLDLQRAGLPIPETVVLEQGSDVDLQAMLGEHELRAAVIKPVVSASAYETHLVDHSNIALVGDRLNAMLKSRTMMLQEFLPEITAVGEWSLMFFAGEYSHAVRKLPKHGDFRVQAEHGGGHVPDVPPNSVMELAYKVVREFAAAALYARVDVVVSKSKPLVMEVELIDPELYVSESEVAARRFADAIEASVRRVPG